MRGRVWFNKRALFGLRKEQRAHPLPKGTALDPSVPRWEHPCFCILLGGERGNVFSREKDEGLYPTPMEALLERGKTVILS